MTIIISQVKEYTVIGSRIRVLIIVDSKEIYHDSASNYEIAYNLVIAFLENYNGTNKS